MNESLLSLSAIQSDGTEIRFDGSPLPSGVHLRWSFLPELGFPAGGFKVEKRFYYGEFLQAREDWVHVGTYKLPAKSNQVLSNLTKPNCLSAEVYKSEAEQVMQLVLQLKTAGMPMHKTPISGGNQPRGQFYLLDLMLMACLDPHIASLLGLYCHDGSVLPGTPVDYRVQGLWGEIPWPKEEISFNKLTPLDFVKGSFSIGKVSFFSSRKLSLERISGNSQILNLSGEGALSLRMLFDHPVQEIEFELARGSEALARDWKIIAVSGTNLLNSGRGGRLTTSFTGLVYRITTPDNQRITEIEISGGPHKSTWKISKISYRRFIRTLSDEVTENSVYSKVVRLNPLSGSRPPEPPEQIETIPLVIPGVEGLPVETLRPVAVPAMIGEDGKVIYNKTNVEISCRVPASTINIASGLSQPVRMQVQYTRTDVPAPGMSESLTAPKPLPFPVPELVAFWNLNGNLNFTNHGSALKWVGPSNENIFRDSREGLRYIDRQQKTLALFRPGYLETQELPVLNNLGITLYLQLWVLPIAGTERFPTLIGNNFQQSFWFGLNRQTNGRYALRFYINGSSPFDSQGEIEINSWSKVAVEYNGREVIFYINDSPAGTFPALAGRIRPNTWNRLCIGCDPQQPPPSSSFDYPFTGYIADVQIWRSLYSYPSSFLNNPHLLAGWTFNNNLTDEKTRTIATLAGNSKFILDHPQDARLNVLYFDGNTFLQDRNRNDLCQPGKQVTIQAWIKPEAGQTLPTIVGNDQSTSYWLGLNRYEEGYRIRLQLNGVSFESTLSVPVNHWSFITVGTDSQQLVFYINGKFAGNQKLSFRRISGNPKNTLSIGADFGSRAGNLRNPFKGSMADLQIWNSMPAAPSPVLLMDQTHGREQQLIREAQLHEKVKLRTDSRLPDSESPDYTSLKIALPFDGSMRDLKTCRYYGSPIGTLRYERSHPVATQRKVLILNGSNCVEVSHLPNDFYSFGNQLSLKAWVNPDPTEPVVNPTDPRQRERQTMTLISNNRETSFAFALQSIGTGYRLWFFLNGREFTSTTTIPARAWSYVGVTYNGQYVFFYIKNQVGPGRLIREPEKGYPAVLGAVRENTLQRLQVGAEVSLDNLRLTTPFRGKLADVEIWNSAPETISEPLPDASGLVIPADYIAQQMQDGVYRFQIQGIDIFGRKSSLTQSDNLTVHSNTRPLVPGSSRAQFLPLRGRVTSITNLNRPDSPEQRVAIAVQGMNLLGLGMEEFGRVYGEFPDGSPRVTRGGLDVEVRQSRAGKSDYIQSLEIESLRNEGESLVFTCILPPFARLNEQDQGAIITIAYDYHLQLSWTWTGTQRLFSPDVDEFKFYERFGVRKQTPGDESGRIITEMPSSWSAVPDRTSAASLPKITPVVEEDIVEQEPSGTPLVMERVSHDEWQNLHGNDPENPNHRGIRWLPEPTVEDSSHPTYSRKPRALLFKVSLPNVRPLASHPQRLAPQRASVENFVPGALVAFNEAEDAQTWQHFQVVWHEWNTTTGWSLYIVQNQPGTHRVEGDPAPDIHPPLPPRLVLARYYPGQRYKTEMPLIALPDFTPTGPDVLSPVGTVPYEVGVVSRDQREQESEISHATLVAVNRQRPPKPPKPRVVIEQANYHGKSRATVTWNTVGVGIRYQLYRAVDNAVVMRDVEQRRLQTGFYEGASSSENRSLEVLLSDDPDFEEWLQATFHPSRFTEPARSQQFWAFLDNWQRSLFVPKPPDTPTADQTNWQLATEVWKAWADRFYPALNPFDFAAISERRGNEKSFSLVNPAPVEGTSYLDMVNGTVINRYLYRLRTQSPSLLQSTEWGPVSDPVAAPQTRAPRAPVFTKIEAGDQEVTLHWALNREKDLKEYRLYRARTREELEDLRWWESTPPDKEMIVIADPRLKIRNNELRVSASINLTHVLGVYRADEYKANDSASPQPLPFNYYRLSQAEGDPIAAEGSFYIFRSLRPIADGTAVVLVSRDDTEETKSLIFLDGGPALKDEGLLGLTDYYYRLLAIGDAGTVSKGSEISRSRTLEIKPPEPPQIIRTERIVASPKDRIEMEISCDPSLEIMIQRKKKESYAWETVLDWSMQSYPFTYSKATQKNVDVVIRVWSRTVNKLVCIDPAVRII